MIIKCTCENKGQDEMYGKDNRVANKTQKPAAPGRAFYRCTVCEKEVLK